MLTVLILSLLVFSVIYNVTLQFQELIQFFFAKNVSLGIFSIHFIPKNTPFGVIAFSSFSSENDNMKAGYFRSLLAACAVPN